MVRNQALRITLRPIAAVGICLLALLLATSMFLTGFGRGATHTAKAASSETEWNMTFGGSGGEYGASVGLTSDNGFIVAGSTDSYGAGGVDVWLVKTNAAGVKQWDVTFGGSGDDDGNSVQQTEDGGYVIAGDTQSFGSGNGDVWLIKTDSSGNQEWDKTYGGAGSDCGNSVYQTTDGGYIITGNTRLEPAGDSDIWLIKTDSSGTEEWDKVFGGSYDDYGVSVEQTMDGGYIIAGSLELAEGFPVRWLIKTDSEGSKEWDNTLAASYSCGSSVHETSDGGYVVAGTVLNDDATDLDLRVLRTDSSGKTIWDKTFDGPGFERGVSVRETDEGGFVVAGLTSSSLSPVSQSEGGVLLSMDANGNMELQRVLGGSGYDWFFSLELTFDGGCIVAGMTSSSGAGGYDMWLLRVPPEGLVSPIASLSPNEGAPGQTLDVAMTGTNFSEPMSVAFGPDITVNSLTVTSSTQMTANITIAAGAALGPRDVSVDMPYGTGGKPGGFTVASAIAPRVEWSRTFGGTGEDFGYSVQQTTDGGYIVAGSRGDEGVWLLKTDAAGNAEWEKTFGGDVAYSVSQTSDGGYIILGIISVPVSEWASQWDIWVIKTDGSGNKVWDKTFGGTDDEEPGFSIQETSDGGYVITGETRSSGDSDGDLWLIKVDSSGNKLWDKVFGQTGYHDEGQAVQQTADGGLVIAGYTTPYGTDNTDVWLIKTDASGSKVWDKTFGGTNPDAAYSVRQTADGGFVIVGYTIPYGTDNTDVWLIKTDAAGNEVWDKTFGGTGYDWCSSVQQTADGGYVMAGKTHSYGAGDGDFWAIRTDASGNKLWDKTLGGTAFEEGCCLDITADGGYILTGATESYGAGQTDVWLVKLAPEAVTNHTPDQPGNASPANAATDVSLTPPLQSSGFHDPDSGDTHAASQWQIRTEPGNYSSPVFDSLEDSTHLTSITTTALSYSTAYYWHVRYKDNRGSWSAWSTETSFTTLSAPHANQAPSQPSNATPASGATDVGLTPALLSSAFSDADSGDTHAASQWQITATAGNYSSPVFDSNADGAHLTGMTAPALSYSTIYYWHVRYQDNHGAWSNWSTETAFTTLANTAAKQEVPAQGGKVETGDGRITADFPGGALSAAATVTIKQVPASEVAENPKGFKMGSTCFSIEARGADGSVLGSLSQPVTITVRYTDDDVAAAGGDLQNLVLAYYDQGSGQWMTLDTTVDTEEMTVSATTTHFSQWAILGKAEAASGGFPVWAWIVIAAGAVLVVGVSALVLRGRLANRH